MAAGKVQVIDLRSDTVTRPTADMRKAMMEAEVGDDVYGEDPTVNELQRRCEALFGMEAALFVPTGTMGNLIAIMVHCQGRGLEAIVGHKSHILLNEQGGLAQFAGVCPRTIQNKEDGTFCLEELKMLIRPPNDIHQPNTKIICLENTQNFCGGKPLPMDFLKEVHKIAKDNNLKVHTDGARVMNAAIALGVPVAEILKYSDSVSMCFSKGLAAPVGSILAGSKDFIAKATRLRKGLGGGMRQAGVLAAAAIYSLDNILPRLHKDHEHAKQIAKAMVEVNSGVISLDPKDIKTNIITMGIVKPGLTAKQFIQRALEVTEKEKEDLGESISLPMVAIYPQVARLLTHNDLHSDMVATAIKKLQYIIREFGQSLEGEGIFK